MSALPSLQSIALALGGRVVRGRNPHVAAPFPGKKKHDRSLHVFINGDDIGVHVFRDGVDPIEIKDHVRRACGLPTWQPTRRKSKPKPAVPFEIRNHFFGETLAVLRFRRRTGAPITEPMFTLLMNDLRLRGDSKDAVKYAREFGQPVASIEQCLTTAPRHYTADERAKILNLTYRERQHLQLRRTGSIDVDKAGRERARRDRYNAKRRAARAAARLPGVNKRSPVEGRSEEKQTEEAVETREAIEVSRKPLGQDNSREVAVKRDERLTGRSLLEVLGDGDGELGRQIAQAIGRAWFRQLRSQFAAGVLYPSCIKAAVRCYRLSAARGIRLEAA